MEFAVIVLAAALVAAIAVLIALVLRLPRKGALNEQVGLLQKELADFKNSQLASANKSLTDQSQFYKSSQAMLNQVHERLGSLAKASEQITELGKDLVGLQDILRAPKLRGGLGEYFLKDLLGQILPEKNFVMQYRFRDGSAVDAAVKLGDKLVPIDSKFPLESFQRMIQAETPQRREAEKKEFVKSARKRIDEIASKYIKVDENTFDFAMMYVPAENVYYEIIITDNASDKGYEIAAYARERKVIPVSPNSIYAYLMTIILGLKGFKIEQEAKNIMAGLSKVQSSFSDFFSDFLLVGKHLKNAESKFEETARKAERFNDRVGQITGVKTDLLESKDG
ncbi:MAG: DNA recombination protein RmuC [Spirochaetales bacterium]|nr:DNA recombination protein RmuC [Spirochaetales bacterium]